MNQCILFIYGRYLYYLHVTQQVFTWGSLSYIGRSGDAQVPGHVQSIPSGETIIKVSCPDGWTMVPIIDSWANQKRVFQDHDAFALYYNENSEAN